MIRYDGIKIISHKIYDSPLFYFLLHKDPHECTRICGLDPDAEAVWFDVLFYVKSGLEAACQNYLAILGD